MNNTINENGINVFVFKQEMSRSYEVWVHDYVGGKPITVVNIDDESGLLIKTKITDEDRDVGFIDPKKFKPFMRIPHWLYDEFIKAFVESMELKGIKPNSQSLIEGELNATKNHLSDMKEVAFKLLKIEPKKQ